MLHVYSNRIDKYFVSDVTKLVRTTQLANDLTNTNLNILLFLQGPIEIYVSRTLVFCIIK